MIGCKERSETIYNSPYLLVIFLYYCGHRFHLVLKDFIISKDDLKGLPVAFLSSE